MIQEITDPDHPCLNGELISRAFDKGRGILHVCEHLGILPSELLMVGNSLKSDIAPALTIGAQAIHIPFHVTWQLEHAEDIEHERLVKIDRFSEIIKLLNVNS